MSNANNRRGSAWGAGLGLLGLLIVVAVILVLARNMLDSGGSSAPSGMNTPGMFEAVNYARATTQNVTDQHNQQIENAMNTASPTPSTPGGSNGEK